MAEKDQKMGAMDISKQASRSGQRVGSLAGKADICDHATSPSLLGQYILGSPTCRCIMPKIPRSANTAGEGGMEVVRL